MSVWKKASKAHQKTHRERHQPEERQHLGLLEKHKDYQKRAQDYNEKKQILKTLRKRALNKNPDEFYHHMINSKTENGKHFEKESEPEDTVEQLQLMRTQDLKYIVNKRTQEQRKIEKLQATLHLTSVEHNVKNQHVRFEKTDSCNAEQEQLKKLAKIKLPDVEPEILEKATRARQSQYNELSKRINREKELAVTQQKIEIRRAVEGNKNVLPPKRVKRGTKEKAPVYLWRYERKR